LGVPEPHADILERRAATLYRLAAGETSLVIAPVASALWRYREGSDYAELTRVLEKDADVPLQDFLAHLGATGYARTEMVELPGQFAGAAESWIFLTGSAAASASRIAWRYRGVGA